MTTRKRDFKKEYQRRIARALAKGKTRQQARGHKPREHIERAQRERERQGLTNAQIRIVFNWASNRLFTVHDNEVDPLDVIQWAKDNGYETFKEYRSEWDAIRRRYLREIKKGIWASRGMGIIQEPTDRLDLYDVSWMYYH